MFQPQTRVSASLVSVSVCVCLYVCTFSHSVTSNSFATLWTLVYQAPLSMGFSRQEYWRGLPLPPPGDLPDPGIEPASLAPPVYHCTTWETPGFYIGDANSQIPVVTTNVSRDCPVFPEGPEWHWWRTTHPEPCPLKCGLMHQQKRCHHWS